MPPKRISNRRVLKKKVLLLTAIIIPTIISAVLFALSVSKTTLSGNLIPWITENRGSVQVIVQVLSTVLGALQTYAIGNAINFWANMRLPSKPATLDRLKLLNAIFAERLDMDLPWRCLLKLCVYLALIQIPGALWAGAITPMITTSEVNGIFQVPAYSASSNHLWGKLCQPGAPCDELLGYSNSLGTFTYLGWKYKSGLLLNAVKQAANSNGSISQYAKLDNTGIVYNGRSYGVASTIGLLDIDISSRSPTTSNESIQEFTFLEVGYNSSVECYRNQTSDLRFYPMTSWAQSLYPWTAIGFIVNGSLPNGNWTGFPTWGVNDNSTLVAISAVANAERYMYGFAAGKYYSNLNMVQCEVSFTPSLFHVHVDVRNKTTTVSLASNEDVEAYAHNTNPDLDPSRALVNTAFFAPSYLSATLTSGYTSVLGRAFSDNNGSYQQTSNHSTGYFGSVLKSVSNGFEALIDHTLGSLGAAQVFLANDRRQVNSNVTVEMLHLGQPEYVFAQFGLSLSILVCIIMVALWTHWWHGLPNINVLDLKCALFSTASTQQNLNMLDISKSWAGDADDSVVGGLKVVLSEDKKKLFFIE